MPQPFELDSEAPTRNATISAVRPLPSRPDTCTILVDRRAVARIPAADVDALDLRPGLPWTEERAAAVERAAARERCRRDALRALARRGLPSAALRARLTGRGHADELAVEIIDELRAAGWIDDEALAFDAAARLHARRPAPAAALARRLEKHQVDPDLAERAARAAAGDTDPVTLALDVARRPLAAARDQPRPTVARRVAGLLARRGFDDDTVATVLDRLDLLADEP